MGGTCRANRTDLCDCPPGFGPDTSFFHFDNCSMPLDFYKWFFVASSCISIPLIFMSIYQFVRAKKTAKKLAMYALMTITLAWLYHLFLYIENGCYVGATITLMLSLATECLMFSHLTLSLVDPLFKLKLDADKLERLRNLLGGRPNRIGLFVLIAPFTILLAYFSVAGSRDAYNGVVIAFILVGISSALVLLITTARWAGRLEGDIRNLSGALQSSKGRAEMDDFLARLRKLKNSALLFAADIVLLFTPVFILYFAVGSIPMSWVFVVVCAYSGAAAFTGIVLRFIRVDRKREPVKERSEGAKTSAAASQGGGGGNNGSKNNAAMAVVAPIGGDEEAGTNDSNRTSTTGGGLNPTNRSSSKAG